MKKAAASSMILTVGILLAIGLALFQLKSLFFSQTKVAQENVVYNFVRDIQRILEKSKAIAGNTTFVYKPIIKDYIFDLENNKIKITDKISGKVMSFTEPQLKMVDEKFENSEKIYIKKVYDYGVILDKECKDQGENCNSLYQCCIEFCWSSEPNQFSCHDSCAPNGEYPADSESCCSGFMNPVTGECEEIPTTVLPIEPVMTEYCLNTLMSGDYDQILAYAEDAGIGWVRELIRWSDVQPNSPDDWNWIYDDWFDEAESRGIQILPRLHAAPEWARTQDGINIGWDQDWGNRPDLDRFDEFANFASEFVKRYNPEYIEIWNEPNFMMEWASTGPNPTEFVDMVCEVKDKFNEEGLDTELVLGGLGSTSTGDNLNEFEFLRQAYDYNPNFGDCYDILGHHPYGYDLPPDHTCADGSNENCWALDRVRLLHDYLSSNWGEKPIMITEFGWWFDWVDGNEETQAQYLYDAFEKIDSEYPFVEKSCWWVMTNYPGWGNSGNMIRDDDNLRPSYYCFQSLTGASCSHSYTRICPCNTPPSNPPSSGGGSGDLFSCSGILNNYVDDYNFYRDEIYSSIEREGLDDFIPTDNAAKLIAAIITQESGWNENTGCSSGWGCGLMQVTEGSAAGCSDIGSWSDMRDYPAKNIQCGIRILKNKISSMDPLNNYDFENLINLTLAAYNGGQGTISRSIESAGDSSWDSIGTIEHLSYGTEYYDVCLNPDLISHCRSEGYDCYECKAYVIQIYVDHVYSYYQDWLSCEGGTSTFRLTWPIDQAEIVRLSSCHGGTVFYGIHEGIDISCVTGTNVYAPEDGVVVALGYSITGGNYMKIKFDDANFWGVFYHLDSFIADEGDHVSKGDLVAISDNTGTFTTAPHLHFHLQDGLYDTSTSYDPCEYLNDKTLCNRYCGTPL